MISYSEIQKATNYFYKNCSTSDKSIIDSNPLWGSQDIYNFFGLGE